MTDFKSCLTSDAAPLLVRDYPSFYVVNKTTSREINAGQSGQHWVVLGFISQDANAEFFDSRCYGLDSYSSEVRDSLLTNGNGKITTNTSPYQLADSNTCGKFCCWFIDLRCMSIPFNKCMHLLSEHDLDQNERRICNYVDRHMCT